MAGAVRGRAGEGDPGAPASGPKAGSGQDPEGTSDALSGDEELVCVDCDARQVQATDRCPSCGGAVVAKHFLEESDYDPLIGRKIGGRFTVIARLGAGSMGAVYRARQDGMSREVALKVLKPERAFDASSKARFEREARATSALTSPHTVTVYDFGEDETTSQGPLLYLAMERLEGESLGARLKRGRIPPKEAVKIAQQTLRSLAEAHEKGVVHRDLKPDNIYLHRVPTPHGLEETVKVLDFGIAKILQPDLKVDSLETQAGTVFGTPRYMSPEQAQSKPLDGRSDLYTIGLILFQMVTGRHCFPDEDAVVVMARHIQSLPPRPREIAPDAGISKKLEALILKTLSKDPKRRPQSALELHEELAAAILEDPGPAPSATTLQSAAVRVDVGASVPPTADPSLEIVTHSVRRRRSRAQMVAYAGAFCFILLGAIALGVRLARTGGSGGVIVEPTTEIKATANEPVQTAAATATTSTAQQPTATIPPVVMTAAPSTTAADTATKKTTKPTSKWKPSSTATAAAEPPPTAEPPPAPTTTTTATQKKSGYQKFE